MAEEAGNCLRQWYIASHEDEECLSPAKESFLQAVSIFKTELTKDPKKQAIEFQSSTLADVENTVRDAQQRYETHRKDGKLRDRLQRLTQVIHHYGNIMDVFVQHHPEYVALAWGAMKFVFVTFLNHEATASALIKGLCQVAAALPRAELSLILYPTSMMKRAIAQLYANIIKFLLRAREWYEEHWAKHLWHAISRPVELRFTGLINDIESLSAAVDNLAMQGSRAEQREMHRKLDQGNSELAALRLEVEGARELISSLKSLMSSAFVNTNSLITSGQASSIIHSIPNKPQLDPKLAYQHNLSMRNRRLKLGLAPSSYPALTPTLHSWSHAAGSSVLALQGPYASRMKLQDLAICLIEILRRAGIPTFWVLHSSASGASAVVLDSPEDVLRCFVQQATALFLINETEATASSIHAQLKASRNIKDFVELLRVCFRNIPVVYVIIDLGGFDLSTDNGPGFSVVPALTQLIDVLRDAGSRTVVKIFTTSWVDGVKPKSLPSSRTNRVDVFRGLDLGQQRPVSFGRPLVRGRGRGAPMRGR